MVPPDIVVTRVSGHYHISRAQGAGKPFSPIDVINRRADAIEPPVSSLLATSACSSTAVAGRANAFRLTARNRAIDIPLSGVAPSGE